jgi:hypothetical protein
MSKSNFLKELLAIDPDIAKDIEAKKQSEPEPSTQFIVYMVGNAPDTVWEYHHKPEDGIPYGRLHGYWHYGQDGGSKFVEHTSNNLKVMPFTKFMDNIVPDKGCTKIYDSYEDFIIDLL